MEEAVSPVLHKSEPAAVVDKVEVPSQLFTTVTSGVTGVVQGATYVKASSNVAVPELFPPGATTVIEMSTVPAD
nr:hypothetical protein [Pontibacter flavimaris]